MVEFKGDEENGFSKRTLDGGWEDINDEKEIELIKSQKASIESYKVKFPDKQNFHYKSGAVVESINCAGEPPRT
eukprot:COSAG01_NODE_131_length_24907_cov_19.802201_5_plen_74_part_00